MECGKLFSSYFSLPCVIGKLFLSLFAPRALVIVITSFFSAPFAFSHTIIFTLVNMAGLDRPEIRLRVRLEYQITVHCWLGKLLHVRWKWNSGDDEAEAKNDVKNFCFYLHTSSRSVCSHANDPCCSRFSSLLKSCERVLILFAWKSRERERETEREENVWTAGEGKWGGWGNAGCYHRTNVDFSLNFVMITVNFS